MPPTGLESRRSSPRRTRCEARRIERRGSHDHVTGRPGLGHRRTVSRGASMPGHGRARVVGGVTDDPDEGRGQGDGLRDHRLGLRPRARRRPVSAGRLPLDLFPPAVPRGAAEPASEASGMAHRLNRMPCPASREEVVVSEAVLRPSTCEGAEPLSGRGVGREAGCRRPWSDPLTRVQGRGRPTGTAFPLRPCADAHPQPARPELLSDTPRS